MGIVDLTTNLKSLRYGKDRIGGGSSGQPYVKSSFPDSLNDTDKTGGVDFLLRGGTLVPGRITKDVSRLAQMFFDTKSPNGLLFVAKQNVLSRTSVRTQVSPIALNDGIYLPTSTLAQAAVNPLGIHLNKQGVDPTGLFGNTGLLSQPQYLKGDKGLFTPRDEIRNTASNRLVQLYENKILQLNLSRHSQNDIPNERDQILKYDGGPGAILGVGKTTIRRYYNSVEEQGSLGLRGGNLSNQAFTILDLNKIRFSSFNVNLGNEIKEDFRNLATPADQQDPNQRLPISLDYSDFNQRLEGRVNIGNPAAKGDKSSYQKGKRNADGDPLGPLDKINALPLYQSDRVIADKVKNDLIKFRIGVISNSNPKLKTYIHFRAFIDSYDDSYSSNWNSQRYVGRAEPFYRYEGFERSINMSWTVAAQSKEELIPMYQKLNYLASVSAPDYSNYGYMRGNLITLTVGGWLHEQVGFIEGINYTVPQESPWEIAIPDGEGDGVTPEGIKTDPSVKEMPMIIQVTGFKFTPIQSFLPQIQQNTFIGAKEYNGASLADDQQGSFISAFGRERYIQLSNGVDVARDNSGEVITDTEGKQRVGGLDNYGDNVTGQEFNKNKTYIPFNQS